MGFADLLDLLLDELPATRGGGVGQQLANLFGSRLLVLELFLDDEDLKPRQAVELELEDGVRLLGIELEAGDDLRGRVGFAVGLADDADDLIERVEHSREAFEDVDALFELFKLVLEPAGDDLQAEVQEVLQNRAQIAAFGPAHLRIVRRNQAGEVDVEIRLQRRVLVEVGEHLLLVGVALQFQFDAHVVGGQVLDVQQQRHFA